MSSLVTKADQTIRTAEINGRFNTLEAHIGGLATKEVQGALVEGQKALVEGQKALVESQKALNERVDKLPTAETLQAEIAKANNTTIRWVLGYITGLFAVFTGIIIGVVGHILG